MLSVEDVLPSIDLPQESVGCEGKYLEKVVDRTEPTYSPVEEVLVLARR